MLSPGGRTYDRNIPAALPAHMMLTRKLPQTFPLYVDLRKYKGPQKDQGQEGACTGFAGSSTGEWIYRRYLEQNPIFSPQYTYVKELIKQGDFPQDNGSDGTTLCETIIQSGFCPTSDFPYISGDIAKPTAVQDQAAAKYKGVRAYHGLTSSETLISILADPQPWPVCVGFDVYASFESSETAKTGIMTIPTKSEQLLGGHENTTTCGYDIGGTPVLRPKGCPPAIWMQNSWGEDWGIDGTYWMPLPIIDASTTDLKVFHLGPPWK